MNQQQKRTKQDSSFNDQLVSQPVSPSIIQPVSPSISQPARLSKQEMLVAKIFALANKQMKNRDNSDAIKTFKGILPHSANPAPIYHNMAVCLERLGLDDDAFEAYRVALKHDPKMVASYTNIGVLLHKHRKVAGSIQVLEKAISLDPDYASAHLNLGIAHTIMSDLKGALQCYRKAVALDPKNFFAQYELICLRHRISDWRNLEEDTQKCLADIRKNDLCINPFNLVTMDAGLDELHHQSLRYIKSIGAIEDKNFTTYKTAPFSKHSKEKRRLKIGFVSSDFKEHPVGYHLLELLETFDRDRFEIFGFCYSRNQDTDIQRNLRAAFDKFVPIKELKDLDAAQLIHENEIDILVNLNGFTSQGRTRLFSYCPAPIQINYLGYPATMGAEFIDYIIADKIVVPMVHERHYTEAIVHLPGTFFPVDCRRKPSKKVPTRSQYGLPEDKFVFSCFNATHKITPKMFRIWMRILDKVEGSVLWLFEANELCKSNIQREIIASNIDPTRVIFAQREDLVEDHQARCALPDLFLDTLPYNAHATSADALCAGLPILTCLGKTFAGRVAASLLTSLDMPEMVTNSLEEYEAAAVDFAHNPAKLKKVRKKLADRLASGPLFGGPDYTRNIELAFENMVHRQKEGKKPRAFAVADLAKN